MLTATVPGHSRRERGAWTQPSRRKAWCARLTAVLSRATLRQPCSWAVWSCFSRCVPAAIYETGNKEVISGLAEVRVGENESFESALRRFNKKIQQSGILAEARRREHYEKPSVKRKRKEAKRKKVARQQQS